MQLLGGKSLALSYPLSSSIRRVFVCFSGGVDRWGEHSFFGEIGEGEIDFQHIGSCIYVDISGDLKRPPAGTLSG